MAFSCGSGVVEQESSVCCSQQEMPYREALIQTVLEKQNSFYRVTI